MREKPSTITYRVSSPLVASVCAEDRRARFVTIPSGSVIVAPLELEPLGLVDVECDGKMLSVFSRDIRERAERIDGAKQGVTP
jgi:hypothetical protein